MVAVEFGRTQQCDVLTVDDDLLILEIIELVVMTTRPKATVIATNHAVSAFGPVTSCPPRVIVLEINLTGLGGAAPIRDVRLSDPSQRIIVFTERSAVEVTLQIQQDVHVVEKAAAGSIVDLGDRILTSLEHSGAVR